MSRFRTSMLTRDDKGRETLLHGDGSTLLSALGDLDAAVNSLFGVSLLACLDSEELSEAIDDLQAQGRHRRIDFSTPESDFELTVEERFLKRPAPTIRTFRKLLV